MLRRAKIDDIPSIYRLLSDFAARGALLARPLSKLYDDIRDFFVFVDPDQDAVLGCCALQICWQDLAEIRSLAVRADCWGRGIGSRLVENAFADARFYEIKKVFVLTYSADFFKRFGFFKIEKSQLPLKIWSDCVTCVKFPDCDEVAMMHVLE